MEKLKSPFVIMDHKKFYEGLIFNTKSGPMQVIEFGNKFNVKVKFLNSGYETIANIDNIIKGHVRDPYAILKNGGYFGVGNFEYYQDTKIYKTWDFMLRRAYVHSSDSPNYENCYVCEQWINLQIFAEWYNSYRIQLNPEYYDDLQIDKDILQWGNYYKTYSPSTCCLIPGSLNGIIANCLDKQHILNTAYKYLINGAITKEIYDIICTLDFPQQIYMNEPYQFDQSIIENRVPEQNVNIDPNIVYTKSARFQNKDKYEGQIFETNFGPAKIENYINYRNVIIRFLNTNSLKTVEMDHLINGKVKDDFLGNVKGKGFVGVGKYDGVNSPKARSVWAHMIDSKSQDPVDPIWLNFQNFAEWYNNYISNLNPLYYDKLHLNKTILQWGNPSMVYSPSGCCLVPDKINVFLSSIIPNKNTNKKLPSGICYINNKYKVKISGLDGQINKTVNTLDEAKKIKYGIQKDKLLYLANFYLSENAITEDIYNILINLNLNLY